MGRGSSWGRAVRASMKGDPDISFSGPDRGNPGLVPWPVISGPSPPGPDGHAGDAPEFPDFLIYEMGTVACTL